MEQECLPAWKPSASRNRSLTTETGDWQSLKLLAHSPSSGSLLFAISLLLCYGQLVSSSKLQALKILECFTLSIHTRRDRDIALLRITADPVNASSDRLAQGGLFPVRFIHSRLWTLLHHRSAQANVSSMDGSRLVRIQHTDSPKLPRCALVGLQGS